MKYISFNEDAIEIKSEFDGVIFVSGARGFISHKNTLPVLEGPCDIWATAATMVVLESTTNVYVNYQGFLHTP